MVASEKTPIGRRPITLALFQPDIPQNAGTILRMAACLGVRVAIIEPAGFPTSDRAFRRAGMDYLDQVEVARHTSWEAFDGWATSIGCRLVLGTTKSATPLTSFEFNDGDVLILGRESAGVPDEVHRRADCRITIPMVAGARSLNIAVSAAILAGEALRQLGAYPTRAPS